MSNRSALSSTPTSPYPEQLDHLLRSAETRNAAWHGPDQRSRVFVGQTVATIQRTAISIAALPSGAREEALFVADRTYANAMLCRGRDVAAAAKWVELVMTAVRMLVAQIDRSGGRYIKVLPAFAA